MPTGQGWDVPPEVRGDIEFRWWKVYGNRNLTLVMLSEQPLWYRGHYYRHRMVPCFGDGCKLCAENVGGQLRYVVAAAEITTHRSGLLEVGDTVAKDLRDIAIRHNGMKGMIVEISKHTFSKQSRMEVSYIDREEPPWWREIDAPDIQKALYLGWQKAGYDVPEFEPRNEVPQSQPRFRRPGG